MNGNLVAKGLLLLMLCQHASFVIAAADETETITSERVSGPVTVRVSLQPKSPIIGDTVKLTIAVTAEKDVEVLMPDFGSALNRFSIVDFAPRQSIDDEGRVIATQTYRLDLPSSGPQVVPPILVEYIDRREGKQTTPEDLDAYEILTDRIKFDVQSVLPSESTDELVPPLGRLDPLPNATNKRSGVAWGFAIGVMTLVSALAIVLWVRSRQRERRRSAFEIANGRLEQLLQSPRETEQQIDQFYVQLTAIIRQYIEDRFEMRAPELTTDEFLASISNSPDFSSEHQGLLHDFLRHADLVKFAGAKPSSDETHRSIETARRFLLETRQGGEDAGH
ncbi:hypothetical protein [Rhodopirellula sp. MGV]|uniref:hypothetical protein n=1 Tax=Rhodopirellula sp. MGV TaxID=2023130 RepID=UPI000B96F615|nr:hypothetical protein [Rhodopirellula sp. MGV]OYP38140.1 hypothetical protein CGZ80_02600 [Rhodopirellula sp. MGV]PNY38477.1 hypothetical protein C2E31_00655 [Rhodopirellula baltica]